MNLNATVRESVVECHEHGVFLASIRSPELHKHYPWASAVWEAADIAFLLMLELLEYRTTALDMFLRKVSCEGRTEEVQRVLRRMKHYFPWYDFKEKDGLIIPDEILEEMYIMSRITDRQCGLATNTALAFLEMHRTYSTDFLLYKLHTDDDSRYTFDMSADIAVGRSHSIAMVYHKPSNTWIAFSPANIFNQDEIRNTPFPTITSASGERFDFQRCSNVLFSSDKDSLLKACLSLESLTFPKDPMEALSRWKVEKFYGPCPEYYWLLPMEGEELTQDNVKVLIVRSFVGDNLVKRKQLNPVFTPVKNQEP